MRVCIKYTPLIKRGIFFYAYIYTRKTIDDKCHDDNNYIHLDYAELIAEKSRKFIETAIEN